MSDIVISKAKSFKDLTEEYPNCFIVNPIVNDRVFYKWIDSKEMEYDYRHIEKEYHVSKDYRHTKDRNVFVPVEVWATGIVQNNIPTEYDKPCRYVVHSNCTGNNFNKIKNNFEILDRVLAQYDGELSEYVLIIPYGFCYNWLSKLFESQPNLEFNYNMLNDIFKNGKSKIKVVIWKQRN